MNSQPSVIFLNECLLLIDMNPKPLSWKSWLLVYSLYIHPYHLRKYCQSLLSVICIFKTVSVSLWLSTLKITILDMIFQMPWTPYDPEFSLPCPWNSLVQSDAMPEISIRILLGEGKQQLAVATREISNKNWSDPELPELWNISQPQKA